MCFICDGEKTSDMETREMIFMDATRAALRVALLENKLRPDLLLHAASVIQFITLQEIAVSAAMMAGQIHQVPSILAMVRRNTVWLNDVADDAEALDEPEKSVVKD